MPPLTVGKISSAPAETRRRSLARQLAGVRVPFMQFFDGFRTSHEVAKAEVLSD
jgi:hypothetical protein